MMLTIFGCCFVEVSKFVLYFKEKKDYHTPFPGSNDAKVATVEVINVRVVLFAVCCLLFLYLLLFKRRKKKKN